MAHTRSFDKTAPLDSVHGGLIGKEIRDLKNDVEERMVLDHYWSSSETTPDGDADGYHKKITMKSISSPSHVDDSIILYTKTVGSTSELFCKDEEDNDCQLTNEGKINYFGNFLWSLYENKQDYTYSLGPGDGGGTWNKTLASQTKLFDGMTEYSTENQVFTAKEAGLYLISMLNYSGYISINNVTTTIERNLVKELSVGATISGAQFIMRLL